MVRLATHAWAPDGAARGSVLLVHGITGWHRTWWRTGPALAARGWHALGVDLRGHGRSPRIGDAVRVGELAADVTETLDALGLARPLAGLVGHSLGGAVVVELAAGDPGLARRIVVEDPPAVTRVDDLAFQAQLAEGVLRARHDPVGERDRVRAANPAWRDEDIDQDVEGRTLADLDGILGSLRADTGVRVLDLAPRLAVPALYLLADEARSAIPGDARRRLLAALPDGSRAEVLDAGHTIHRDRFDDHLAHVAGWLELG